MEHLLLTEYDKELNNIGEMGANDSDSTRMKPPLLVRTPMTNSLFCLSAYGRKGFIQHYRLNMNMTHNIPNLKSLFILLCAANLTILGDVSASGFAIDEGRNLAFTSYYGTVAIVDISTPSSLSLISSTIQAQANVKDLDFDDATQMLYVAADDGDLEIWDIQNPGAPQQVSTVKFLSYGNEIPVISVAVSGNIAHVASGQSSVGGANISNPSNPVALYSGGLANQSREVYTADGKIFIATNDTTVCDLNLDGTLNSCRSNQYFGSFHVFGDENYVYSANSSTFNIQDANQTGLPVVGQYSFDGGVSSIFVANDLAYVGRGSELRILDLSDKQNMVEIGVDAGYALATEVIGNHAFVKAAGGEVRVVDVSDPTSPVMVSSFDVVGAIADSGDNIPPVSRPDSDLSSVPTRSTATIFGSNSSDADGVIVSYSWKQVAGPTVKLGDTSRESITFKTPKKVKSPTDLIFELTVTDDDDASATADTRITVYRR